MHKKVMQRSSAVLSVIGMLFWLMAGVLLHTSAAGSGSLTMHCKTLEGVILSDMRWNLYEVAVRQPDGTYALQGDFTKYPISLKDTSTAGLSAAAETLETIAVLTKISPDATGITDAYGDLEFHDLDTALYLVAGESVRMGDTVLEPAPFLVEISGAQDFNMEVNPKYIVKSTGQSEWNYTVRKIWEGDTEATTHRTDYVMIEIYRDGTLYETVRLDASNDWTYAWSADSYYDWRVMETEIPDFYTVVYRSNENQYVIVNSYTDDSSIDETSPSTDSQMTDVSTTKETDSSITDTSTADTGVQTTSAKTTTTSTKTSTIDKLPQTGQLWWPVPVLAASGVILIAVGLRLRTKE